MANKSKRIDIRLSEKDHNTIKEKASKANLTITAYITKSALNKNIINIEGLGETITELKGIGRNLNQLTTLCNMGKIKALGLDDIKKQFNRTYELINNITQVK